MGVRKRAFKRDVEGFSYGGPSSSAADYIQTARCLGSLPFPATVLQKHYKVFTRSLWGHHALMGPNEVVHVT